MTKGKGKKKERSGRDELYNKALSSTSGRNISKPRKCKSETSFEDTKKMAMVMRVGSPFSSLQQSLSKSKFMDYTKYLSQEDVVFEIFRRLPLEAIFKCRCVSKLWESVLSNPEFIMWIILKHFSAPPWTIVYPLNDHLTEPHPSSMQLFTTVSPEIYFKFIANYDGFSFKFLGEERIYPLASTTGLVLCSTTEYYQRKYYVCNPLTKKWVSLPPPRPWYSARKSVLNGFICASSSPTNASTFKVVRIPLFSDPKTKFNLEIFSSDTGEWKTHKVSCPQEVTLLYHYWSNAVSLNGILYWVEGRNRIIACNLDNGENGSSPECKLINLPKDIERNKDYFYDRCLGESEGFICYCQIQRRQKTLRVLMLEGDYSNGKWLWHTVHENIELKDIIAAAVGDGTFRNIEKPAVIFMRPLAFHPWDRNIVILNCRPFIFAYNIETRTSQLLRQTADYSFDVWHSVLPFMLTPMPTKIAPLLTVPK